MKSLLFWGLLLLVSAYSFGLEVLNLRDKVDSAIYPKAEALILSNETSAALILPSLPPLPAAPAYLPLEWIQSQWHLPADYALVGQGTLWLPGLAWPQEQKDFVAQLLNFLSTQDPPGTLILLPQIDPPLNPPEESTFRLLTKIRSGSYLKGTIQIGWKGNPGSQEKILTLNVSSQIPVVCTKNSTESGMEITERIVCWQEVDLIQNHLLKPQDEKGKMIQATRYLAPGEVLKPGMNCRFISPVESGDQVLVTLAKGAIQVEMTAKALEKGELGQQVRIRLDSGKMIQGRVEGRKILSIILP